MTKYDRKHWQNVQRYMKGTQSAFSSMVTRITKLYDRVPTDVPFNINNYPWLKKGIDAELRKLASELHGNIVNGISQEWALSNAKNDEMLAKYIGGRNVPNALMAAYMDRNIPALDAFRTRFAGGKDLSKRVWDIVKGQAVRMEEHMALGIYEGTSAKRLATEMKQYLNSPDALFRRVRDAGGNLQLSAAARDYSPGQGVYRSAYKNALRMTRTETNASYQAADNERWEKTDFILGVRVQRSNRVAPYPCDICESAVGEYPKDYNWSDYPETSERTHQFHPQCMCYATPILASWEQMDKYVDNYMDGKEYQFTGQVEKPPESYINFREKHPEYKHY